VPLRVEAVDLVPRAAEFARQRGVSAPILTAMDALLAGRASREELLRGLMTAANVHGA
jgi:hypothetical protein